MDSPYCQLYRLALTYRLPLNTKIADCRTVGMLVSLEICFFTCSPALMINSDKTSTARMRLNNCIHVLILTILNCTTNFFDLTTMMGLTPRISTFKLHHNQLKTTWQDCWESHMCLNALFLGWQLIMLVSVCWASEETYMLGSLVHWHCWNDPQNPF